MDPPKDVVQQFVFVRGIASRLLTFVQIQSGSAQTAIERLARTVSVLLKKTSEFSIFHRNIIMKHQLHEFTIITPLHNHKSYRSIIPKVMIPITLHDSINPAGLVRRGVAKFV